MTFAPPRLLEVRRFFQARDPSLTDEELGIAGGPSHALTGTSYHLGADQLKMSRDPYSARTRRDRAGLSNAASAFDLSDRVGAGRAELRELSIWVVAQCRAGASDTLDFREVIFSPDGVVVLTWDRERGVSSFPLQRGSLSHREHTHFGWYRDSEHRDKTGVFRRFYTERGDMSWETRITDAGVTTEAWKWLTGSNIASWQAVELLKTIAAKLGTDPAQLEAIAAAARAGAQAGVLASVDELIAAFIAALPDDVASREDVVSALREVLTQGVGDLPGT